MSTIRPTANRIQTCRMMLVLVCMSTFVVIQSGCVDTLMMAGKVLMGDPVQPSGFELATGVSLAEDQKRVLVHCSAPSYLSDEFDTLTSDIQEELIRRMKRRGMAVMHADAAADVLDDYAGQFDPNLLAMQLDDVDYIFHVQFESFTYREDNSPNLYRGKASGKIVAHEIVRGKDGAGQHAIQVYDQLFNMTHPTTHPVAVDQMPKTVFIRKFTNKLADELGHTFYSVKRMYSVKIMYSV